MSEEFGTVNIKDRAREIELARKRYQRHREALVEMSADAPTEHLAAEYRRLIQEVDVALGKISELDPGARPLVAPPTPLPADDEPTSAQSRIVLIVVAGLVVLAIIGWLMWRASSEERPVTPVTTAVEETETATETEAPPPVAAAALQIEPQAIDFGVVRKGTRAARQFEIVNTTDQAIPVTVARSACRCLYYDYADSIPPKGRETLTVTVDGAKAEAGILRESIAVTSKGDSSVATSFDITATVQ